MSDIIEMIKKQTLAASIACIVIGVLFCVWPGSILMFVCRLAGIILFVAGIVFFVWGLIDNETLSRSTKLIPGIIGIVIGLWVLARPYFFVVIIPIVIGILLIYRGVRNLMFCASHAEFKNFGWGSTLVTGIAAVLFGILLMIYSLVAVKGFVILVGLLLIYDGACGLWREGRTDQ